MTLTDIITIIAGVAIPVLGLVLHVERRISRIEGMLKLSDETTRFYHRHNRK